jgi:hypothetical protein
MRRAPAAAAIWTCAGCNAERNKPEKRLPSGWHKRADEVLCSTCWGARYLLRAIAMQVVSPLDCEWKDLRVSLSAMWALTTQASNWMVTQLYSRDVKRTNEPKMPPMSRVYLYPEARERFPGLPSQSVAALEQAVQKKYRAARYELIWTCARSLPTFRYPIPFAVPNQGWSAQLLEAQKPVVSVRIGEARYRLRLKGGPGFRRQRAAFGQICSGEAVQGELALYQQGDHLMCKLVAWLPRPPVPSGKTGTLSVRTDRDCLLVALDATKESLWKYNADHIVRRFREHRDQLQRWAGDQKYEQRPVPSFAARRAKAVERYHASVRSAVQQIAAELVGYAKRRKFAEVKYDDKVTDYAPQFPWFALRDRIAVNCDEAGIVFTHASGELAEETPEPLAKGKEE